MLYAQNKSVTVGTSSTCTLTTEEAHTANEDNHDTIRIMNYPGGLPVQLHTRRVGTTCDGIRLKNRVRSAFSPNPDDAILYQLC